jgi:hypothetical protein
MERKNLEKYRPIQFSTPNSPVFSEVKYSLPFARYFIVKVWVFSNFDNLGEGVFDIAFWENRTFPPQKILPKITRPPLNANQKGIIFPYLIG